MRIERLFHVLVVTGASATAGLVGCGDEEGQDGNTGGSATAGSSGGGSGGSSAGSGGSNAGSGGSSAGSSSAGSGGSSSGDACESKCGPNPANAGWTDCDGCCCWLPAGANVPSGSPICPEEPCCEGRGR